MEAIEHLEGVRVDISPRDGVFGAGKDAGFDHAGIIAKPPGVQKCKS
jgi:hypothetical protein